MSKDKKIKQGLGKGLGALIPSIELTDKGFKFKDDDVGTGGVPEIYVKEITTNPYQPRKTFEREALEELKKSIKARGVLVPITVRKKDKGYELISGERRLRAVTELKMATVPAHIIEVETDVEMLELALIENIQREDLNPIEEAYGFQSLIEEFNFTQEEVAERVGKDRSTVANTLRLIKLPEEIKESIRDNELKMGHARALLSLENKHDMLHAWRDVVKYKLSVRATEKLVKDIQVGRIRYTDIGDRIKEEKIEILTNEEKAILIDQENKLRHIYGTQVKIHAKSKDAGTVEFDFYSKDDLERLLEIFALRKS